MRITSPWQRQGDVTDSSRPTTDSYEQPRGIRVQLDNSDESDRACRGGRLLMATVEPITRRTPAQRASEGFAILVEKLGMADAIRFVQLDDPGHGDYTQDRYRWLSG